MKGRPKTIRRISFIPTVSGFKPYGEKVNSSRKEGIFLYYEEYEALRLNDYEKLCHCKAAACMGISRPTFTRIYKSAREKIAQAFVEGRKIIVEGGKVELDNQWYICENCHAIYSTHPGDPTDCALCGSNHVTPYHLSDTTGIKNM